MKHQRSIRKFGREMNQRNALVKSLALSLVLKGKITTTEPKAKEIRPFVEKLVTKAKLGTLAARRILISRVSEEGASELMDVLAPKYKARAGGYLRITKLPSRKSDAAKMAVIEFV
jgi:large subunit ribosomal protein L17